MKGTSHSDLYHFQYLTCFTRRIVQPRQVLDAYSLDLMYTCGPGLVFGCAGNLTVANMLHEKYEKMVEGELANESAALSHTCYLFWSVGRFTIDCGPLGSSMLRTKNCHVCNIDRTRLARNPNPR